VVAAVVTGIASAVPTAATQEQLWNDFFAEHFAGNPLAERIWNRAGVESRHGVAVPWKEDVRPWGTEARMRRFIEEARPLGVEAIEACLADAGLAPQDVDALTVVTCTGYGSPGLDVLLAQDLGMSDEMQRLHLGHMGCHAALPGLGLLADAAVARGKTGLLLCIELCSLHIQPPTDEVDQVIAHALFADAAAAVAVRPGGSGMEVVDVVSRTDAASAPLMTWDVTDSGFRMGLSPRIPDVLRRHVPEVIAPLLGAHGLRVRDVAGWAIHPGGPRILEATAEALGLEEENVAASRSILRDYGNCSSPTVLLILERLLQGGTLAGGDPLVAMAFGPGLTLSAALLVQRESAGRAAS
jgi:alkylresorcinol/alkylpyrone synthase